jgi:predicted RNA-binding Zn-ribbon protein involved in translation (DUF1610 family)
LITENLYRIYLLNLSDINISKEVAKKEGFKLNSLKYLIKKQYLFVNQNQEFEISEDGKDFVNSMISYPEYIPSSTRAWNLEANTKMRPDGRQTKKENIVILKSTYVEPSYEMSEEDIDVISLVKKIAKNTNRSELEICDAISNGLVKLCKTCGEYSIFQKNSSRTSGLQTQCSKCRKKFSNQKIN